MKSKAAVRLSEHDIQKQILDWLEAKHIFHWRNNTGAMGGEHKGKRWFVRFGKKGAPDIFAVVDGKIIGIEVKREDGKLSMDQAQWGAEFTAAGGIYVVTRSLEDMEVVFAYVGRGSRAPEKP